MGIYISGLEMPTRCCDCKMYVEDIYCCHLLNREIENPWADDGVELDCPLVPVPKHGRLIDADAVYKRLQKQAMSVWGDGNPRYQIILDVMDAIRFAPTIIPAEEGEA